MILQRIQYLQMAYLNVLNSNIDEPISFRKCCEQAIKQIMSEIGIHVMTNYRTIMIWNRVFRTNEMFPHPHYYVEMGKTEQPVFLESFPEVQMELSKFVKLLTESESGNKVRIPRSHPTAAEKRLGVRYSIDGKWTQEFAFWKDFSTKPTAIPVSKTTTHNRSRKKWQYFIRYIADEKGLLFTPLGQWIRKPYQQFPYILGKNRSMLYVQKDRQWEIYYLCSGSRNNYIKAGITATKLPKDWVPINVLRLSNNILKGIRPEKSYFEKEHEGNKQFGNFDEEVEKKVVGYFEVNKPELDILTTIWGQQQVTIFCGCDGGLKGSIGTSGYVLYGRSSDTPLVFGHSAEAQSSGASSMRQELLAQLCIEYWLDHLIRTLGEPGCHLSVQLVTDSKASIDILDNMENKIGMTEFLKPDMDVAMAVAARRARRSRCKMDIIKVNSHIGLEEAPDEFHWRLNEEADKLATLARTKVESGRMASRKPVLLPESKVTCSVDGILCTNNMTQVIHHALTTPMIQEYLCIKYGWTASVFSNINWSAHQAGIAQYQLLPKITVIKYIHG